jgi:phosphohistidine swiveling domain-containing protein
VVGTWNATNSINDGDKIKIDGNVGIVEILERAK